MNAPLVFVAVSFTRSGTEQIILNLATRFIGLGKDVCIVVPTGSAPLDRLEDEARALGASVARVPPLYPGERSKISSFKALVTLFRRLRPALVHFHIPRALSGFESLAAAYVSRVPVRLRTEHNPFISHPSRREKLRLAAADRMVHRIAFVSTSNRDNHLERFARPRSKCVVIPNGIDPATVLGEASPERRQAIRSELRVSPEARLAVMLGALEERKGGRDFIRALKIAAALAPNLHGVVIGDGEIRGAMEESARELGIHDRVHFMGRRSDARQLLSSFDLYVQPSHYEGMALSMLEALAAGLPMASTRVAGVSDIFPDGQGVSLVDVHDCDALGKAMAQLSEDEPYCRTLGEKARARVRDQFTVDKMFERYRALYRELGVT